MLSVGLDQFLVLSAVLFCIGLFGVLTQRNVIKIIMCVEIMLNAVNITLIAFSRYVTPVILTGHWFASVCYPAGAHRQKAQVMG